MTRSTESPPIVPVILSGGSGTRLWPLSRPERPKQFLPLVTERSLLQDTVLRLEAIAAGTAAPIVVCNEAHRHLVAEQLEALGIGAPTIVLEPGGRNTAPAIAAAALMARQTAGEDALLLVLPSDHVIADEARFAAAAGQAIAAAATGRLVTFGIVPTHPETGYGYLLKGTDYGGWADLERFVEKPDLETARGYVDSGQYLWNSGMFVFPVRELLDELERHTPAILECTGRAVAAAALEQGFTRLGAAFLESPAESIDYAVMEKTARAAVVPLDAGWNDVGSWAALHALGQPDATGNVTRGDVALADTQNSFVLSSGRRVAVLGVEGLLIVETPDAVLITRIDRAQDVKKLAEADRGDGSV
jgi:mannose-1-phosphate guanylyltransferase/mannose-6-phosphate isomerase